MKTNILDKIGFIVIITTILLLNLFIGSNIKDPIWVIQVAVSIFAFIYLVIKKARKETNLIIKSKIDIAVLIFMFSIIIPYIANTYVSLEGTINFILKYWSVYGFYILIRNIIIDNKKLELFIKWLIYASVIPILFGIDKMTFNIAEPFLNLINAVKIEDVRMISTFGYANTLAAYLSLTTSLAIACYSNSKCKSWKIAYGIYIIVASITILLTQSKMVFGIVGIILLGFIFKGIKDKKISKKWILLAILAIFLFFTYFFIAIQIPKNLEITQKEKTCVIRGIEPNSKYTFAFKLDTETDKNYDCFEINIIEVNRYFAEKNLGRISFGKFSGTKTINIETTDLVDHIEIRISNLLEKKITVSELKINNKPYILEYKIIPEEVVRVFTTFNFKNPSVWQRVDYWTDGFEIVKKYGLFGAGGNAWRILYGQEQDYLYYAKEAHCYLLEIWMSFGIIGILSYLFVLAITMKNSIEWVKKSKEDRASCRNKLATIIGISIIILHSFMDFDMSYLIIEMVIFAFIAIANNDDIGLKNKCKFVDWIIIIIMSVIIIGNVLGFIASIVEDETWVKSSKLASWITRYQYNKIVYLENNQLDAEEKIELIKEFIKKEPYVYQNIMYEIGSRSIINTINKENIDDKIKDIEFFINIWENVPRDRTYEVTELQKRTEIFLAFAENLIQKSKEMQNNKLIDCAEKILDIIYKEYDENIEKVFDYNKNLEGEKINEYRIEFYKNVYREAIELNN